MEAAGSKTFKLMSVIRTKIAGRVYAPGDRLPSVRSFATSMGVSPSTVVEAYDRLCAEGLVRAHRGSGFYVASASLLPLSRPVDEFRYDREVDLLWLSRQSLDADSTFLKPGCGWLPADWMPDNELRRSLRTLARAESTVLTEYGGSRGSLTLRKLLASRFAEEGIDLAPDHILLTASGSQAIDLILRLLLRPGDTVLVDDPCYFNFHALLRAHNVDMIGVPYTKTGPDIGHFEALLAAKRPRLYLTNSAIHNPTGGTMSTQVAHRLLNAATSHDLVIIEDETFSDFEPEPSPRLAALDGLNRVIRIGSFSKTMTASARCGYIAARTEWIEELIDLQLAFNLGGGSPVAAALITNVLKNGGYRKHMDEVRLRLVRARREVVGLMEKLGIEPWIEPRGGFYIWSRMPNGIDASHVALSALSEKVVLAPGNLFSTSNSSSDFMPIQCSSFKGPQNLDCSAQYFCKNVDFTKWISQSTW